MAKHTTSLNPTNSDSKPCLDFLRKNCNKGLDQKNVVTEITTTKVFLKPPQFPKKNLCTLQHQKWVLLGEYPSSSVPKYSPICNVWPQFVYIYIYYIYMYIDRKKNIHSIFSFEPIPWGQRLFPGIHWPHKSHPQQGRKSSAPSAPSQRMDFCCFFPVVWKVKSWRNFYIHRWVIYVAIYGPSIMKLWSLQENIRWFFHQLMFFEGGGKLSCFCCWRGSEAVPKCLSEWKREVQNDFWYNAHLKPFASFATILWASIWILIDSEIIFSEHSIFSTRTYHISYNNIHQISPQLRFHIPRTSQRSPVRPLRLQPHLAGHFPVNSLIFFVVVPGKHTNSWIPSSWFVQVDGSFSSAWAVFQVLLICFRTFKIRDFPPTATNHDSWCSFRVPF